MLSLYLAWTTLNFEVQRGKALEAAKQMDGGKGIINLGSTGKGDPWQMAVQQLPQVRFNVDRQNDQPKFLYADLEDGRLPLYDRQVSVAFASHVLEHLSNWEGALTEWNRVADNVVVVLPHPWSIVGRLAPDHKQFFSFGDVVEMQRRFPRTTVFM